MEKKTKCCIGCNISLNDENWSNHSKEIKWNRCNSCIRKYYRSRHDYNRRYYEKNKLKHMEYQRKYRIKNREHYNASRKKYYHEVEAPSQKEFASQYTLAQIKSTINVQEMWEKLKNNNDEKTNT